MARVVLFEELMYMWVPSPYRLILRSLKTPERNILSLGSMKTAKRLKYNSAKLTPNISALVWKPLGGATVDVGLVRRVCKSLYISGGRGPLRHPVYCVG